MFSFRILSPHRISESYRSGVQPPYPDQPVSSFATAWQAAKKAAGFECKWHNLRHSTASRIAAGRATDHTLQALLGWMSHKMIEKYSHLRSEAKRQCVRCGQPRNGVSTISTTVSGRWSLKHHVYYSFYWSGRRDSNPRPSAPKLDDQQILKDLAGAIGALSNAKERVETPTVGLKWGCRTSCD